MSASCHSGHRERMRARYFQDENFNSFADHELLEMDLGMAIARKNTNETAHDLLERFGSLRNVLEASVGELKEVDGIGDIAAVNLKLSVELARRYLIDVFAPRPKVDALSDALKFMYPKFFGQTREYVYMLSLDNRFRIIDCRLISTGTPSQSNIPIPKMIRIALEKNAAHVVVAHNHPHGIAMASGADRAVTEMLYQKFMSAGINFIEHLVFADDEFYPIMKKFPRMSFKTPMDNNILQTQIDGTFYDVDEETFRFSQYLEKEFL